ncbi:MAG: sugar phosphate isomerase/epimerase [Candidatus Eremiobacteraeota bacterium]|nr:sugar phosphate isomerase/epimerase [Candidatus Eremiobacteraeota bacterium]
MKLSIVISISGAEFSAVVFKESHEMAIEKAAKLGYDGVELAVRDPAIVNIRRLKDLLEKYNLEVPALGTGQAYGEEGLSLTDPDEHIRKKAIERLESHVKMASELNSRVIIGLIRGKFSEILNPTETLNLLKVSVQQLCDQAKKFNVELVIEPINRYETDLINTVDEALDFMANVNRDNLKILVDTFHMNIEEPSIFDSINRAGEKIGHVHIADSNRLAAGRGHIDFKKVIGSLKKVGYNGFLSAEILPKPTPDEAAKLNYIYMAELLGNENNTAPGQNL